jgi:Fe-S-cluster-containing dehydrogenase component
MESKAATCDIRPGRRPRGPALDELVDEHRRRALGKGETGHERHATADADLRRRLRRGRGPPAHGFFTDTSVCIGRKACEVACKEWNAVPESPLRFSGASYDNTLQLGAHNWHHVAFVERQEAPDDGGMRWLMGSDVCKHCTSAACLEVCPTGALFRTEFGTVVVQADVCNGCGYCVPACPFGVIERREEDGRAFKTTLCYDRLKDGLEPACAKACPPTRSSSARSRSCASARPPAWRSCTGAKWPMRACTWPTPGTGRRGRRVLPAAGRAGGVRAAARPGLDHPRPARAVALGRAGGGRAGRGDRRGVPGRQAMSDGDGVRSYYGRPVIKAPPWTDEVPWYFFTGGLAGASAGLSLAARLAGNDRLARDAIAAAAAGVSAGLPLLVADLGRPERSTTCCDCSSRPRR